MHRNGGDGRFFWWQGAFLSPLPGNGPINDQQNAICTRNVLPCGQCVCDLFRPHVTDAFFRFCFPLRSARRKIQRCIRIVQGTGWSSCNRLFPDSFHINEREFTEMNIRIGTLTTNFTRRYVMTLNNVRKHTWMC